MNHECRSSNGAWIETTEAPVTLKRCCRCKKTKPRAKFHRNRTRPDGLASECRHCKNRVENARYHLRKNREMVAKASSPSTPNESS